MHFNIWKVDTKIWITVPSFAEPWLFVSDERLEILILSCPGSVMTGLILSYQVEIDPVTSSVWLDCLLYFRLIVLTHHIHLCRRHILVYFLRLLLERSPQEGANWGGKEGSYLSCYLYWKSDDDVCRISRWSLSNSVRWTRMRQLPRSNIVVEVCFKIK